MTDDDALKVHQQMMFSKAVKQRVKTLKALESGHSLKWNYIYHHIFSVESYIQQLRNQLQGNLHAFDVSYEEQENLPGHRITVHKLKGATSENN